MIIQVNDAMLFAEMRACHRRVLRTLHFLKNNRCFLTTSGRGSTGIVIPTISLVLFLTNTHMDAVERAKLRHGLPAVDMGALKQNF